MPLHQASAYDPISSMVELKTSAIFEMLVSLAGVVVGPKLHELRDEVRAALGEDFLEATSELYGYINAPLPFAELAVDYPDRDDVEGFLTHVSEWSNRTFAFYGLGRFFPLEAIPETPDSQSIRALIGSHENAEYVGSFFPHLEWIDRIEDVRAALCSQWRRYWREFLKGRVGRFREVWNRSLDEKREMLEVVGGAEIIREIYGFNLPLPLPGANRIEVIPVYNIWKRKFGFYGFGTHQILYDCSRTLERERDVEEIKRRSLAVLKALADENRLKIVKRIAGHESGTGGSELNGTMIATFLDLSQSVVSRNLTQLKSAGLIAEHKSDKRKLTYSFQAARLRQLLSDLETFIRD